MACLICKYFQPLEPEGHRQMRESGRCEQHCGDRWDGHTAVHYVKDHGKNLDGFCQWGPEPKRVSSGHVCAQIDVPDYFFNPHWALKRMNPDERLKEWSLKQYEKLLEGSWETERRNHLEEQNKELRRQLEASRKISASRLARLQKDQKQEPKQEHPPLEYPYLVAAE
jgi:hypothetical protein